MNNSSHNNPDQHPTLPIEIDGKTAFICPHVFESASHAGARIQAQLRYLFVNRGIDTIPNLDYSDPGQINGDLTNQDTKDAIYNFKKLHGRLDEQNYWSNFELNNEDKELLNSLVPVT